MTEEEQAAQAAQAAQEAADKAAAEATADPVAMAKKIAELNHENAQRRIREKELADKLEKFNAAQKEAEEKAQAEKGEFKTLYETAKEKIEGAESKVAIYEATLNKMLDAETANVPENMRGLIPDGDVATKLAWIATAKAAKLFATPAGPGVREPGQHATGTLESELAEAKESGNVAAQISIKKKIYDRDHK